MEVYARSVLSPYTLLQVVYNRGAYLHTENTPRVQRAVCSVSVTLSVMSLHCMIFSQVLVRRESGRRRIRGVWSREEWRESATPVHEASKQGESNLKILSEA